MVGLGAGGARLWLARPQVAQEYDYELIAAPLDLEIVPGFSSPALAYGGQCPGVELRAKQGEWLRVRFTNRLDEPTTIHWHGIRLPIEMDGVPYISSRRCSRARASSTSSRPRTPAATGTTRT